MSKFLLAFGLIVLTSTAQADIICTLTGCWETGKKIILVSPGHVNGAPLISHRNGKPEKIRNLGRAEETTPRR